MSTLLPTIFAVVGDAELLPLTKTKAKNLINKKTKMRQKKTKNNKYKIKIKKKKTKCPKKTQIKWVKNKI